MKKGFWIGLIIVAAIFLLAGGYIFVTVRNYLDSDKWEVHDPIPDDRRTFYANTALMPELSDDFERFAIRGIRDFDYMVETYSFSGTDEMYGKLRSQKGYSRHPGSLYRIYRALGFTSKAPSTKKKRKPQKYHTPEDLGIKWQMDVKYVPAACYVGEVPDKFFQYTMIDEASRERFIYPYVEQSSYSTIDFVKRAIAYFGYKPETIQTDNGFEFTYPKDYGHAHPFDIFCEEVGISHKLIRPRTPWHNGKVERSHRNDQERFYNFLSLYSFMDLRAQMYRYMRRSNNIPMAVLGWMSPLERRAQLEG